MICKLIEIYDENLARGHKIEKKKREFTTKFCFFRFRHCYKIQTFLLSKRSRLRAHIEGGFIEKKNSSKDNFPVE